MYENIKNFYFYFLGSEETIEESSPTDSTASQTDAMILYDINHNLEQINYHASSLVLISLVIIILKFHNMLRSAFKNNSREI